MVAGLAIWMTGKDAPSPTFAMQAPQPKIDIQLDKYQTPQAAVMRDGDYTIYFNNMEEPWRMTVIKDGKIVPLNNRD